MSDLLMGEDGTPHFPLFWSLEPRRVPGFKFDQLSFDEKIDVAFLRNQAPIDCGFLLENEDLSARLRQTLDKMPPKADVPRVLVNEKSMRRWLKKARGDPGAQGDVQSMKKVANEEQTAVKVIPTTLPQPQASIKPPTAQKQAGAHMSSENQAHSSSIPIIAEKWWTLFNNFEGPDGGDVNSIFDRRFPVEQELTGKLKATESSAQTIAFLEQSLLEARTKLTAAENEKKVSEVKYADLVTKHSNATTVQVKLKKDFDDVVAEKDKLAQDLAEAIEHKKQLVEDKGKLDLDLDALQKEIAIQHARGFHKAIDQVKVLNPTVDVEGVGVFKKNVEGKLVDESEDEEE
ncbi:hypothetical protein SESBI_45671 [Sesbania bispinosa]|nr:hypothetical protein SESBI_45671 [Sesbania bispinosa]